MDAYQQTHRFMRPPTPPQPPSPADPHHQHHHYQYHNQQQPPPPPQGQWYNSQFQYHPSQSSPQWAPPPPPPHSDHLGPLPNYAPPPNHPYPAHPHPHYNQFPPPPRPHGPPPPPNHQIPQSYPQASQEWGNTNWAHHQGWEHPVQKNEEDWAARAKAWAEAKAAMDIQHPQSQFAPVGRPEEQIRYHEHYPQTNDSHYSDIQQPTLPPLSYQQFPNPAAAPHRPPFDHLQDVASISSGQLSYVSDGHLPYTVRDGTLAGDPNALYPHQETTRSSVHQQEVPSSYSSATGKEEATDQNEQVYRSFPLRSSSTQEGQQHMQPIQPANGRSVSIEQPFTYGNQSSDISIDLSDQPLDFAPRFNRDRHLHMQSGYAHSDSVGPVRGVDPAASVTSVHTWTPPVTPGGVFPSIAPVLPSGPQHDPSFGVPSSVPGHSAPPFGRFPGPSFHTAIPTAGTPFGLGAGASLHPTTAFPGDAYGGSGVSERPKKASVPNWLREEIIKTKPVITISHEPPEEETQSIEDDGVDKSVRKGDQADSKSIDSSRSTEEEDDDEDYVEAARTTAINHEIKRVLTEVLLKVTDELFDEIATKVLSEDNLTVEVDRNAMASNHVVSPSSPAVPTPKASAKVLIPVKSKETETESVSGKSGSSTRGDVLGLANYASDDDDDDGDDDEEIQTSGVLNSRKNAARQQLNSKNQSEDVHVVQNGGSQVQHEEHIGGHTNMEGGPSRASPSKNNHNAASGQLSDNKEVRELGLSSVDLTHSSQTVPGYRNDEKYVGGGKMLDDTSASMSNDIEGEKGKMKSELPGEIVIVKKISTDDSQGKETRLTSDKNNRHESKRIPVKDFVKEEESGKNKADENRRRHDVRHLKKERTDNGNGLKERTKEQDIKPGRKAKESESRKKFTHSYVKGDRKETERLHRVSADEDNRKRERTKEKEKEDHRSRHRHVTDSSRHKRRRSSSVSSRDKNGKDNSVSYTHGSSDEASDDSKRKLRSRKRSLSPSPVRSRRRGVSRSPHSTHSKHSVRRHSPYSSLETPRGRRSRSKSPVRRHR